MKLFPAIDLKDGRVVRLFKGDYGQVERYEIAPADAARDFYARGARYLHVVDLDGARDGTLSNYEVIAQILRTAEMFIEVGGGIRDESSHVQQTFPRGVPDDALPVSYGAADSPCAPSSDGKPDACQGGCGKDGISESALFFRRVPESLRHVAGSVAASCRPGISGNSPADSVSRRISRGGGERPRNFLLLFCFSAWTNRFSGVYYCTCNSSRGRPRNRWNAQSTGTG